MVLKKVAITGASGMVGTYLIEEAIRRGIDLVCISRRAPLTSQKNWIQLDLADIPVPAKLDEIFSGVDAIIHAGAYVPKPNAIVDENHILKVNVNATFELSKWASEHNVPLVFLSGATVYKNAFESDINENSAQGLSNIGGLYGYTKFLAEQALNFYVGKNSSKFVILRPSSIYGMGLSADKLVMKFLLTAKRNEIIKVTAPVDDKVDLVHALDVAQACFSSLVNESWGVFNIASGRLYSYKDIAEACVKITGNGKVEIEKTIQSRLPLTQFALNTDLARKKLNFHTTFTLEQGLKEILIRI